MDTLGLENVLNLTFSNTSKDATNHNQRIAIFKDKASKLMPQRY